MSLAISGTHDHAGDFSVYRMTPSNRSELLHLPITQRNMDKNRSDVGANYDDHFPDGKYNQMLIENCTNEQPNEDSSFTAFPRENIQNI